MNITRRQFLKQAAGALAFVAMPAIAKQAIDTIPEPVLALSGPQTMSLGDASLLEIGDIIQIGDAKQLYRVTECIFDHDGFKGIVTSIDGMFDYEPEETKNARNQFIAKMNHYDHKVR